MGQIQINLTNFLTIGLIAFLFVFIANRGIGAVMASRAQAE